MQHYNLDIFSGNKCKRTDSGCMVKSNGSTIHFFGKDGVQSGVVAFITNKASARSLMEQKPIIQCKVYLLILQINLHCYQERGKVYWNCRQLVKCGRKYLITSFVYQRSRKSLPSSLEITSVHLEMKIMKTRTFAEIR